MIRHIVMWKFREGEEKNREKFLSGLQALDGVIPEIRHMEIHRSCKPGNPYDACLIADFDDLDALSRYKNDPRSSSMSSAAARVSAASSRRSPITSSQQEAPATAISTCLCWRPHPCRKWRI